MSVLCGLLGLNRHTTQTSMPTGDQGHSHAAKTDTHARLEEPHTLYPAAGSHGHTPRSSPGQTLIILAPATWRQDRRERRAVGADFSGGEVPGWTEKERLGLWGRGRSPRHEECESGERQGRDGTFLRGCKAGDRNRTPPLTEGTTRG